MAKKKTKEHSVDVAVMGAGTSGIGAARAAIQHGVSVALIQNGPYGTTCARVGCMPSKLLIAAAEAAEGIRKAPGFGIESDAPRVDGQAVMRRVQSERDRFANFHNLKGIEHDLPTVQEFQGYAKFVDDKTLQVGDDTIIKADRIIIATGSSPSCPHAWKDSVGDLLLTTDSIFELEDLPESIAAFGGGAIGLELAQAYHRLGVRIRLFGRGGSVAALTDPSVIDYAAKALSEAFPFLPDGDVRNVGREGDEVVVTFIDDGGAEKTERFQYLFAATGRRPNVVDLGLENTGLPLNERGIPVFNDHTMQVGDSTVFVAGDVDNKVPLLHEGADEARIAGDNAALYPDIKAQPRRAHLSVVFCDPQITMAGMTLREIETAGIPHAIGEACFEHQGRSRVMLKNKGLLRVYGEQGTGRFLGAEMIGPEAEHIGHLLAWAAQARLTVQQMTDNPFYHPVIEEGVRTALKQLNHELLIGPVPVVNGHDHGPGG
jgi:dihydrolipoamide dehydrogenase